MGAELLGLARKESPRDRLRRPWQREGGQEGSNDRDISQGPPASHFQLETNTENPWSTGNISAQLGSARREGVPTKRRGLKKNRLNTSVRKLERQDLAGQNGTGSGASKSPFQGNDVARVTRKTK